MPVAGNARSTRIALMPVRPALILLALLSLPATLHAHGGVVEEDDLCVINIGYLKAHFKIYVPGVSGHDEYCEDIPVRGESVFVMEYQHQGLSEAEIDFRIIENTTGKGVFARLSDVEDLADLDAVTLRHEPASIVPGVYTLLQTFDRDGEYIGIVSARQPDTGKLYTAVFPFEVGYTGLGYWPFIIGAIVLLQLNFWFFARRRRQASAVATGLLCLLLADLAPADEPVMYRSDAGHYVVTFEPSTETLEINRIHSWHLTVTDTDRKLLGNLEIEVDGGMPEHDHGMPTRPQVVASKTAGHYRVDGVRFHMPGRWEIRISIFDGQRRDFVTIGINPT